MTPAAQVFLDNHAQALGQSLGIEIVEIDKTRVVAKAVIGAGHVTEVDAVQGGMVMAIADVAGALGAVLNVADGYGTSTLESKSNFLARGAGNVLWAESTPIHVGRTTSVWRTRVFRGAGQDWGSCIAEVVQTQLNLPNDVREVGDKPDEKAGEHGDSARTAGTERGEGGAEVVSLADTRRQQILEGACKVMARKGFAKASVREIADAAGMPIPTMYKYIRSKEDILAAVYESFLVEFREQLAELVSRPRPPEEQLEVAISATLATFDKYHERVKLLFRETKSLSPEARRRVFELDRTYLSQWIQIIEDAGLDKKLDVDSEILANLIYYLTTVWPMRHWALGQWNIEDIKRAMTRIVFAMLHGEPMPVAQRAK